MPLDIEWSDEARADVRRLDKIIAQRIFTGLLRFARTGQGDIKQLQAVTGSYREKRLGRSPLRVGDYRVFVSQTGQTLRIHSVRHRREAYR